MSNQWTKAVNQSVGLERIESIYDFLCVDENADSSPIDTFYKNIQEILLVATPAFLNELLQPPHNVQR